MIVAILVDPKVLDDIAAAPDSGLSAEFQAVLEDILDSGVLIMDTTGHIVESLQNGIENLPEVHRQRLQILLDELLVSDQSGDICRIVKVPSDNVADDHIHAFAASIPNMYDSLVASEELILIDMENGDLLPDHKTTLLSSYSASRVHRLAREIREPFSPDRLGSKGQVTRRLSPAMRYASEVILIDTYFLKLGNRTQQRRLLDGLSYLFTTLRKSSLYGNDTIKISLYSVEPRTVREGMERSEVINGKKAENEEAVAEFTDKILGPLRSRFPAWTFELHVKSDPDEDDRISHARYLATSYALLNFDKGFRLFRTNGEFIRNPIRCVPTEWFQVNDFKRLPDSHCSPPLMADSIRT